MKIRRVIETSEGQIVKDYSYPLEDEARSLYGSFRKKSHFVKTFYNNGELPKYSKRVYLADFFILVKKLSPELNMIGHLDINGWRPIQPLELSKILGVSQTSAYRFLKESKELKVISELTLNGEIYLFINPSYAFNGVMLNPLLFWMFKDCDIFNSKLSAEELIYLENIKSGTLALNLEQEISKMKKDEKELT